ncbi:hypothetical protein FA15DRAFT_379502 [Coprinopsis marcescibilis]|uniref:DUF3445 domain-containing protein n=1 Tax=Coprinopsis marcescibilis TaxID=230819 RepID=A0A5C3KXP8_COPMA|nr:hypothetical protein FA15DRAFT_379502 [Coprinopsis marcescibilis]
MRLESDWWIELESTYIQRVAQRKELHSKYGHTILNYLPGSELACRELMFTVIDFLQKRYPFQFSFQPRSGLFENKILGIIEDVNNVEPLFFLLNHVPEDFMIVQKDSSTNKYHLRAGVSCSAIGWNMKDKMGKPLHEVHQPVPLYEQSLRHSMDRYFDKLSCDKPIQRGSWTFEAGQPLFLQVEDPGYAAHKQYNPELRIEDVHLRVDWQTLRRLPESGAIVFNFKALFTPVTEFRKEPYIPQLVARVLRDSQTSIKDYKSWQHLEHKLLPALDQWAQEQRDLGVVPPGWEERTLDEHPFYPGWDYSL